MHKKRIILFFMSVSIGLMPIQAFAAETTDSIVSEATEDISDLSEFDETTVPDNLSSSFSAKSEYLNSIMSTDAFEEMYSNIQSMVTTTDQTSLADYYKENYEITIPSGDFFDVSDVDITSGYDNSITNAQYLALAYNFTENYNQMVDASGQSGNSMQIFQQEYGDIANSLKLETPTIPKGFDMSSLVSSAASSVISTYKSALNSSGVSAVRDSIDTQWIFDKALSGPDNYSLKSYKTLQSINSAASNANNKTQSSRFNASVSHNKDAYKKLSGDVLTKSQSDLMKVIDTDSSYLLTENDRQKRKIANEKLKAATKVSGKVQRKWAWLTDQAQDGWDFIKGNVKESVDDVTETADKISDKWASFTGAKDSKIYKINEFMKEQEKKEKNK